MIPLFTADEEIKILRETLRDLELKLKMREECLNNLKEGIRSMATAWFKVTEVVAVVADSDRVKEVVNSQQLIKQQRDRVVETRQQMQDARDAKIIALHDDGLSAYQISIKVGITAEGVRQRLKRKGINPRKVIHV